MSLRLGILGPLCLVVDGDEVDVPGPLRRAVLAMLAVTPGRVVPGERLLDAVWPGEAPASGRRALHSHMSRLRGHLGPAAGRLTRDGEGYSLDLRPGELDAAEARALAAAAAQAAPADAARQLAQALALWRGSALAEFPEVAPLAAEAVALAELRSRLTDDWLEARLLSASRRRSPVARSAGGPGSATAGPRTSAPGGQDAPAEADGSGDAELVDDAARAAAEAPLRERTHVLLVRALAAAGRPAEALRAAHTFRHRLTDEAGLSPGPALDATEQEVALGVLSPPGPSVRRPTARPASPLVGRDYDLAALRRHVTTQRLTTVIGPGGVGKTRLAKEVVAELAASCPPGWAGSAGAGSAAATFRPDELDDRDDPDEPDYPDFPDYPPDPSGPAGRPTGRREAGSAGPSRPADGESGEVVIVELAMVENATHVADALADALGARGRGDGPAVEACVDALGARPALVLLDHCEQVIDAVRDMVAALLARCRGLAVVATSREPLALPDEHLLRLGPLPVPEDGGADMGRSPAVAAFLAHTRRRLPDLTLDPSNAPAVAGLVRRLDGVPLALELAAGRIHDADVAERLAGLGRALDLPGNGWGTVSSRTGPRLRAVVEWSYRDLGDDGQRLLRALAVFPGGVDPATAERVGSRVGVIGDAATVLAGLVAASLLVPDADGGADPGAGRVRPREAVRAFALDALVEANEREPAEREMVAWAVDLAGLLDRRARGPDEARANAILHAELPNLTAAWAAAGRHRDLDARVALVLRLDHLRTYRDLPSLSRWPLALADDPSLPAHPQCLEVLGAAARTAAMAGRLDRAVSLGHQALAPGGGPEAAYRGVDALARVALFRGQAVEAADRWEEAAALAPPDLAGWFLAPAALAATYAGDRERAESLLARSGAGAPEAAPSARALADHARAELLAGSDPAGATDGYGRAIGTARDCGAAFVEGIASVGLVRLWADGGRTGQALAGYQALLEAWRRTAHWVQLRTALRNLAGPLTDAGQASTAALVLAAADAAPDASSVTAPAVVAEREELTRRLGEQLGEEAYATARQLGARLPRSDVVAAALSAIRTAVGPR